MVEHRAIKAQYTKLLFILTRCSRLLITEQLNLFATEPRNQRYNNQSFTKGEGEDGVGGWVGCLCAQAWGWEGMRTGVPGAAEAWAAVHEPSLGLDDVEYSAGWRAGSAVGLWERHPQCHIPIVITE